MKIYVIEGNYIENEAEMAMHRDAGCDCAGECGPEWYHICESGVIHNGKPFFLPAPEDGHRLFLTVAVKIERLGKSIASKFSPRYYSQATAAVCVQNRPLLEALKREGKPWGRAVSFDGALWLGDFVEASRLLDSKLILCQNGEVNDVFDCSRVKFGIDSLIEKVSATSTLKIGDMILVSVGGEGVPTRIDSGVTAGLENETLLRISVR